ncbi:GntR family transcriptional regulator, partial [Streptomyces viridochromogenes DSM 40736]
MPTDRIRDHAGQGAATTVAAHRARRRLRADRARQLADLLRRQLLADAFPDGTLPLESTLGDPTTAPAATRSARHSTCCGPRRLVERQPGVGTVFVAHKY